MLPRAIALLFVASGIVTAAEPTWGDAVDGLRIGLVAQGATLHVIYENVGTSQEILIGALSESGPMYSVKLSAMHSDGHLSCFDLRILAEPQGVGGYVSPIVVGISPGKRFDLALPMAKLICVENR
jgi:hypothetical protein